MPNLNLNIFLQAYSDKNSSNSPSLSSFRWNRSAQSLQVSNPGESIIQLAPSETRALFDNSRVLNQDNTTQYSISLQPSTSNTYNLTWSSGTQPDFRTPRVTGADATTQVTVTTNGPVVTFASTGGTNFNLISGGAVVGDTVFIGNLFNQLNQGFWQIIALTTTSFTIANLNGFNEGPITLGSGFASQIQIFSADGVQINDKLVISGGFSEFTFGTYIITAVFANSLQFYSTAILPQQNNIQTESIAIYFASKQFVYAESDQPCDININGIITEEIIPFINNGLACPGLFMRTSAIYSMAVTNNGTTTANVVLLSVE